MSTSRPARPALRPAALLTAALPQRQWAVLLAMLTSWLFVLGGVHGSAHHSLEHDHDGCGGQGVYASAQAHHHEGCTLCLVGKVVQGTALPAPPALLAHVSPLAPPAPSETDVDPSRRQSAPPSLRGPPARS